MSTLILELLKKQVDQMEQQQKQINMLLQAFKLMANPETKSAITAMSNQAMFLGIVQRRVTGPQHQDHPLSIL